MDIKNLNPNSRLAKATKILSNIGVHVQVKDVSRDHTRKLVKDLEVIDSEGAKVIDDIISSLEAFDDVVREQVSEMKTADRYEIVRKNFKSILDDAERMVHQVNDDGKVGMVDRIKNKVMTLRRGSIEGRFDELRNVSQKVFSDVDTQITREMIILEAYTEFRGALKEASNTALSLLEKAEVRKNEYADKLTNAQNAIEEARGNGMSAIDIGQFELARDGAKVDFDREDRRYQTAIDISEQLNIAYGVSEAVMTKLQQTTQVKDAQQRKTATFYTANSGTLTALMMAFKSIHGLHEATQMLNANVEGTRDALSRLGDIGTNVQENAIKATYGATVDAASLKKLYESAVKFEEMHRKSVESMREVSRKNDQEIRKVIEDGQKRLAEVAKGGSVKPAVINEPVLSIAVARVSVEPAQEDIELEGISSKSLEKKTMKAEAPSSSPSRFKP